MSLLYNNFQKDVTAGLEIKLFFQGAQLHLQKLPKVVLYRKQYIFGLPAFEGAPGEFKVVLGYWLPRALN